MKAILYHYDKKSSRIKCFIPYKRKEWREAIKQLETSWYHPSQKLWSITNDKDILEQLKTILNGEYEMHHPITKPSIPLKKIDGIQLEILDLYVRKATLKAYSANTIKAYKSNFIHFLVFFEGIKIDELSKDQIEGFLYKLKSKYNISERKQSIMINAIKFYYEKVLGRPKEMYQFTRPKKSKTLPNILSKQEIIRLLQASENIKHQCIITLMYSSGLRISEVPNIRIDDIYSDDGYIFIRGSKQKKDRHVVLSKVMLELLRAYYKKHKPSYWLFEGVDGGQYSVASIRKVFRKMAEIADISPWATPHTLRHSYATHLLENGTSLRQIQASLGHNSSKTTEIYTHVLYVNNKTMKSPLDLLY